MNQFKMVIVMRKDLGMRKGKMIAQGSHASMAFLLEKILCAPIVNDHPFVFGVTLTKLELAWEDAGQKKIVVSVNSEEELVDIYNRSKEAGIPVHMITDAGHTELSPNTKTCLALGPWHSDEIDKITGGLPLL